MSKISNSVNKAIQKIKLLQNRFNTNIGLRVFTHGENLKGVNTKRNISYGNYKLQKFDLIVPVNKIENLIPIVFYIHGGAWCGGDKCSYTMYCEKIAQSGYIVVNINYRLMPKVSIKTCVADVIKAIDYFIHNSKEIIKDTNLSFNPDFNNVYLVGDSAGAHIASLIAAKKTIGKLKLECNISALGLYYGVYEFKNISHDTSAIMTNLDKYWRSIYKNVAPIYKSISTTNFVTDNFPPTFMTSGEIDKLHFQSEVLYRLLKYNNVKVTYLSFDKSRQDAKHAFLNAPMLKSAKEAFNGIVSFFKEHKN